MAREPSEHSLGDAAKTSGAVAVAEGMNPEGYSEGMPEARPLPPESVNEPMSDRDLLSICQQELDSALGWTGTRLAEARRILLNEYLGNPRGDERSGRSQVITREVFEQIEWLIPDLMEIFTSGNTVVRFLPTGAEDEPMAEQATETVNYIARQNDIDDVLETLFKDALIQKSGVCKVTWEESAEALVEDYEGKPFIELMGLMEDPDLHIKEITFWAEIDGQRVEFEDGEKAAVVPPEMLYFDAHCVRTNLNGGIVLENIPPEQFGANRDARSLEDRTCRFVYQRIRTTESELIAWGFDPVLVKGLPSSDSVYTTDQDEIIRSSQDDSQPLTNSYRKDSQRTIWINEIYILVDRDGDGISEWWKVYAGGEYGQVYMASEQVDGHPFVSVTPIKIPYRLHGFSLADVTRDLQVVSTSIRRLFLDSEYLSIEPRYAVLSRASGNLTGTQSAQPMANLTQLVNGEPGSFVEEYESGAVRPLETRDAAVHALPAMELLDQWVTNRTGISPQTKVEPGMVNQTAYGMMVQTSGQGKRTAGYAKSFAKGVRRIYALIYKLLMKHQSKPLMIRLRGEWTPVDPTQWKSGMDAQIAVGLGHGSRLEKAAAAQSIMETQKGLAEAGLANMVQPDDVWASVTAYIEALGYTNPERFFSRTSPDNPPPEPPPDPAMLAVERQAQIELMKAQNDAAKLQLDAKKAEWDHEEKILEIRAKYGVSDTAAPMEVPGPPYAGTGSVGGNGGMPAG